MANKLEKICLDHNLKKKFLISLNKRQVLELDTVLNFVEIKNKKNTISNVMKTTFKMAKDLKMNPIWITYDQAISLINENDRNVFVIDNFKADIFELLRKNSNNLVFGPDCIYFCKSNLLLPIKKLPVLNLSMWNIDICLDDNLKNKLEYFIGLVNLMGGNVTKKIRPSTTHLISKDFFSEKSIMARLYSIPIMTEEWIKKCWESSLHQTSYADEDEIILRKYKLPIFQNIFITVSQIEEKTKKKIQDLVVKYGGKFSGELNVENVTHLILSNPKGNKYEYAKNFKKIKIVTPEWIYDSVKSGYPLIEDKYSFKKLEVTKKFDFSQQSGFSQLSQFSILSSQQEKNKSSKNLSQLSITFSTESSQTKKTDDSNITNNQKENCQQKSAFSMLTSFSQSKQKNLSMEEKFKNLAEKSTRNNASIFDGCDFYLLDEIQSNVKIFLKKCITLQNGFVSSCLRPSVTHVVKSNELSNSKLKELDQKLEKFDHNVNKVDIEWVYNCLKANKHLPLVNVISFSQNSQSQPGINQPKFSSSQLSIKSNFPTSSTQNNFMPKNKSTGQSLRPKELIPSDVEDNVFNDYFSQELNSNFKNNTNLELINQKPLNGCVITFSLFEEKIKQDLKKIATKLGAICQECFSRSDKPSQSMLKNTHLICDEASGKKYEKSKEWGIICCTQEWLRKCELLQKKLDEKGFNPKVKNKNGENSTRLFKCTIEKTRNQVPFNSVPFSSQLNLFVESSNSPSVVSGSSQGSQKTFSNMNSTNEVSIQSKLENLKSMISSNVYNKNNEQDNLVCSNLNHKIDILNTNNSLINNKQLDHSIPIAWNDFQSKHNSIENNQTFSLPDEFRNNTSIKNNQYHEDSYYARSLNDSSIVVRDNLIKQNDKSFEIFQDTMSVKTDSILKISFNVQYPDEKLKKYIKKLETMNIKVVITEYDFSHLIVDENSFKKNEAFFISLSSGKYIVHKSFVKKIIDTGVIPKSEEYEWCNEKFYSLFTRNDMPLIKAYKYWRIKIEKTGKMAFDGQEFILVSPKAKSFVNVIQSSGGKVTSIALFEKSPSAYKCALIEIIKKFKEKEYKNVDYILIDFSKNEFESFNVLNLIEVLEKMNIKCYFITYIQDYLIQNATFDSSAHRISKVYNSRRLKRARVEEINDLTNSKMAKIN